MLYNEDFLDLGTLRDLGSELQRPECVLCQANGTVTVSNWRGGVTRIRPDGSQTDIIDTSHGDQLKPNGIALLENGSYLLANLGDAGGVWKLSPDGQAEPWLTHVGGEALPPCNYVMLDRFNRIWVTVSTRKVPRKLGYRADVNDGFIILVEGNSAQIVADGLAYTNEVQLDPSGKWLYVNETFGRYLSRFPVLANGTLGARQQVATFGPGCYPDGMAFDSEGGIWITSIVSNRILRYSHARLDVMLQDADNEYLEWVEQAYQSGTMDRVHLDTIKSEQFKSISSVAFGGADLKTLHIGCLLGTQINALESRVGGVPPVHWHWD